MINKKKRNKKNKTPKKSEPFIIDFYPSEEKIEPKILFQEEIIRERWTKIKEIPTFTVKYVEKSASHTFEHMIPNAKKKNKK